MRIGVMPSCFSFFTGKYEGRPGSGVNPSGTSKQAAGERVSGGQLAQDAVQYAAVTVILNLRRGIDAYPHLERFLLPVFIRSGDRQLFGRAVTDATEIEALMTGQAQRGRILTVHKLQRQHTHADEVGAVNAFVTFGDDGPHSQQAGPLRGPVAG